MTKEKDTKENIASAGHTTVAQTSDSDRLITIHSSRFGDFEVAESCLIHFPSGIIGFPQHQNYVMLEHKPPFSWLHSADDPSLAFVIVDGFEFGSQYQLTAPIGDKDIDLKEADEYAMLVIVTIRANIGQATANLKAPLFVNLRNRKGVQIIHDNPNLSTRFPLWAEAEEGK